MVWIVKWRRYYNQAKTCRLCIQGIACLGSPADFLKNKPTQWLPLRLYHLISLVQQALLCPVLKTGALLLIWSVLTVVVTIHDIDLEWFKLKNENKIMYFNSFAFTGSKYMQLSCFMLESFHHDVENQSWESISHINNLIVGHFP